MTIEIWFSAFPINMKIELMTLLKLTGAFFTFNIKCSTTYFYIYSRFERVWTLTITILIFGINDIGLIFLNPGVEWDPIDLPPTFVTYYQKFKRKNYVWWNSLNSK